MARIIRFLKVIWPAAIAAGLTVAATAAAKPNVAVSIKPVHSLVAGVMAGAGEPLLLVDGSASEHAYALRPSQAAALGRADMIFWVGPQLENFLIRPLNTLGAAAQQIALWQSPGVRLLPLRDAGEAHEGHGGSNESPPGGAHDMHIWLDPANAAAMVREIATRLQALDPPNAAVYAKNAGALRVRLAASEQMIAARLRAAPPAPYIVFHDAYQYFEARFGVQPRGVITLDPHRPPGAARIRAVRRLIIGAGVACVFAEPQFESRLVDTLIEGTQARAATLDPLGAAIKSGGEHYFTLLDQLAGALSGCAAL